MTSNLLKNILKESQYEISYGIQFITDKFSDDLALKEFYEDFNKEFEDEFNEILLKITDQDIRNVIRFYEVQNAKMPTLNLDDGQFLEVSHFVRKIDGYLVVSNLSGYKNSTNPTKELIYLDDIILNRFEEINFFYSFSVENELKELNFLYKLLNKISSRMSKIHEQKNIENKVNLISAMAYELNLDKTEEFKKIIRKEINDAQSIDAKKTVCLKHITRSKQILTESKVNIKGIKETDLNNTFLSFDSIPKKIVEWLELELEYLNNISDLTSKEELENQKETLESRTKNIIEDRFLFMSKADLRKHKVILGNEDFNKLIEWVTYYFENNFELPKINDPIKKVNTSKGNVFYTFKLVFDDLYPSCTRPDSLYNLIKLCFYEYRNDKISNIQKFKEPQYYKDLINIDN